MDRGCFHRGFFSFFLFFLMLFRNKNEKEKPQIQPSPVSTRRVGRLKIVIWYLQYRCGLVVINQWMTNPKLHQNSWSWHCQLCVSSNVNSNNNKLKKWSAPYPKSCCYLLWNITAEEMFVLKITDLLYSLWPLTLQILCQRNHISVKYTQWKYNNGSFGVHCIVNHR